MRPDFIIFIRNHNSSTSFSDWVPLRQPKRFQKTDCDSRGYTP